MAAGSCCLAVGNRWSACRSVAPRFPGQPKPDLIFHHALAFIIIVLAQCVFFIVSYQVIGLPQSQFSLQTTETRLCHQPSRSHCGSTHTICNSVHIRPGLAVHIRSRLAQKRGKMRGSIEPHIFVSSFSCAACCARRLWPRRLALAASASSSAAWARWARCVWVVRVARVVRTGCPRCPMARHYRQWPPPQNFGM